MAVKFLVVNAFLMVFVESHTKECHSVFDHNITVSNETGHNDFECLHNSSGLLKCQTLDFVLNELMNSTSLQSSTKIEIEGNQTLQKNYNLTKLTDFALCGAAKNQKSEIECNFGSGLIIQSSKRIDIERLSFRGCGSKQQSNDHENRSFYTGIFLVNTFDVRIHHCNISDSIGIGMTLFDVGGRVTFHHSVFQRNRGNLPKRTEFLSGVPVADVGGGVMVKFTYRSDLSNSVYYFHHCKFINNDCTWNSPGEKKNQYGPAELVGDKSDMFGYGGGIGMFFRGQSQNNMVTIDHCEFKNNSADWGGGYLFYFHDKSQNNSVKLKHVISHSNNANFAGGGGMFGLFSHIGYSDGVKFRPNYFKHAHCKYQYNSGRWGGAIAIDGSTEFSENYHKNFNLSFNHCIWFRNQAVVGSALGLLSKWIYSQQQVKQPSGKQLAYIIQLAHCTFKKNIIIDYITEGTGKVVIGTGTIFSDIASIIMQNVSLSFNNGTALVLDWSYVYLYDYVIFHKNNGCKGGAIALYGRSGVILGENSLLNFSSNAALLQGGAIYAHSQGADLDAFQVQILERPTCLFSYSKMHVPPENWTAKVTFYNNSAPLKSGKSVYADTLQFCRNHGSLERALEWIPVFDYIPSSQDNNTLNPEIVTDPVTIKTEKNSWKVFPGQKFNPIIDLRDEKNQTTNGLLKISVKSNSLVDLEKEVSHYIYISNGKSATPLYLRSSKQTGIYDIALSSVYTQVIRTTLENITTLGCFGGYVFDKKSQKCRCIEKDKMPFGYSRCKGDGKTIYLKKGYWGITDKDGQLSVFPCPAGYCKCTNELDKRETEKDECIYIRFDNENNQCEKNRHGQLCGSCMKGFSVVVGEQNCRRCSNIGLLWFIPIVAGLTIAVLAIIYFEVDFFSGHLNSWLYTYHIIPLLPASDRYLDPFITFVISLTNGTFDISKGTCFWDGMDALQKHTLQYLTPFYCLSLLYFISKLLRYFPDLPISGHSFHQAFVTIVIISYASLLRNTFTILKPIVIHGKIYVFIQADFKYFGGKHLPYAIPALLILFLLVIPFPFIIAFNGFFTRHFKYLRSFMPLFEVLQRPYRIERCWFASYYIFCRLFFFLIMMASPVFQYSKIAVCESVCVIVLMVFVLLQPYSPESGFFKVDTVFLSLLCLINSLTNAMQVNEDPATVSFFRILIRILTYIPFVYSLGLLMRHIRQSWNAHQLRRREQERAPLLQ